MPFGVPSVNRHQSSGSHAQTETSAKRVQGPVDSAKGRFDFAGILASLDPLRLWPGENRAQKARACLDQQNSYPYANVGETVTTALADALDKAMGPKLAQIVSKLTQSGVVLLKAVSDEQSASQIRRPPVPHQPSCMEQTFEQTDDAIIVELDARDPARPNKNGLGQRRQNAGVHGGFQ